MLPIGEVKETDNPVAPAAARVARAGIGGFPVETPEEARDRAQAQLALLQKEAEADPTLANDESHQREIARAVARASGTPAPAPAPAPAPTSENQKSVSNFKVPTWDEVKAMPEMKKLSSSELEQARNQYFSDVVLPTVPLGMADQARTAFDADTKPSALSRVVGVVKDAVDELHKDTASLIARRGVSLSGESLDQLERSYRSLKQGVFAVDLGATRRALDTIDRVDGGERLMPADDPMNIRTMSPERRAQTRAKLQDGYADDLRTIAKEAVEISGLYQNPNAVEAIRAANNAQWRNAWNAFAADPIGIVKDLSLSNAAQIAPMAGLGIAGAAVKGVPGLMLGFAGGSFPVDYAMSLVEYLGDQGIDLKDYKAVDAALRQPGFLDKLQNYAATHAAGVTVGDTVMGKTMKPVTGTIMQATKAAAGNVAKGVAGESGGEALGELLAEGKIKPGDVIAEGLAAGPMTVAGSTASTIAREKGVAPQAPRSSAPIPAEEVLGSEPPPAAPNAAAPQATGTVPPPPRGSSPQAEAAAAAQPTEASNAATTGQEQGIDQLEHQGAHGERPAAGPSGGDRAQEGGQKQEAPRGAVPGVDASQKGDQVAFTPTHEWQTVPAEAVLPPGLEIRMNMQTGQSEARLAPGTGTVDEAAHQAATSPTNELPTPSVAQKEAGNYQKGHTKIGGLDVSIENPAGSRRRPAWPMLKDHYGYVRGTIGYDKDHVDVFVKPGTPEEWNGTAYVVNQNKADGKFDEHKVMLGFDSEDAARKAYLSNYSKGWKGLASIAAMSMDEFKSWATDKTDAGPNGGPVAPIEGEQKELSPAEQKRRTDLRRKAAERKQIDPQRDSLVSAVIKLGGLNTEHRLDITGDDKGNKGIPGVGYLFSARGGGPDDLATRLGQFGYITKAELEDVDGGVQALKDKIADELSGRRTHYSASSEAAYQAEAKRQAEMEEDRAKAIGEAVDHDVDLTIAPEELQAEGLPSDAETVAHAELGARAEAIEEGILERLAMQHDSDDAYWAAVVKFLKDHEDAANQRPDEKGHRLREEEGEGAGVRQSHGAPAQAGEAAESGAAEVAPPAGRLKELVGRYKPDNPFAEKAARARAKYERMVQPTARDKAMEQAFPLGAGYGRKGGEKRIESTVNRAVEAEQARKDAEYDEARAAAFDRGEVNAQGRSITKESQERSEKRQASEKDRAKRIQEATAARAGKQKWQVPASVWADSTGNFGGGARKLIVAEHNEAVIKALDEGKDVPLEVLAELPPTVDIPKLEGFKPGDQVLDGKKEGRIDRLVVTDESPPRARAQVAFGDHDKFVDLKDLRKVGTEAAPATSTEVSKLEEQFGSDEALGVIFPPEEEDRPSHFADGRDAVICTNCAIQVVRKLGKRAQIWGFSETDNPTARVVREAETGHDFAVVDDRYIVDPWIKLVASLLPRAVYDMQDQADAKLVAEWYGPREKWGRLEEAEQMASINYDENGGRVEKPAESAPAERPSLNLTAQTEDELKAEDLKRAKELEEKRARENAPPPEEFTLTGSSRPADEAAARGQNELFDQGALFRKQQAEASKPAESPKPGETSIEDLRLSMKPYIDEHTGLYKLAGDDNRPRRRELMTMILGRPAKSDELTLKAMLAALVSRIGLDPEKLATVEQERAAWNWAQMGKAEQPSAAPANPVAAAADALANAAEALIAAAEGKPAPAAKPLGDVPQSRRSEIVEEYKTYTGQRLTLQHNAEKDQWGVITFTNEGTTVGQWFKAEDEQKARDRYAKLVEQDKSEAEVHRANVRKETSDLSRPMSIAQHDKIMQRAREGDITPDELKAALERTAKSEDAIKAELRKYSKEQLGERMGRRPYSSDKKESVVDQAYVDMLSDYTLGESYTYSPFSAGGGPLTGIRGTVEKTTTDTIVRYAERVKAARTERAERLAKIKKTMENPQTLEEFETFARYHKQGEAGLTAEQRARYDELRAAAGREKRAKEQEQRATVQAAGEKVGAKIIETKHTRDGYDLFVVQLEKRVERDDYNKLIAAAKKLGGWYSSFKGNGAVPGFQFKTKEAAEAFQKLTSEGDTEAVKEIALERRQGNREAKKNAAAERLAEMADRMEESAQQRLSADRLTNTARRARMAASAEAQAAADERMAKTLRAISDAIEGGTATNLAGIRTRAQVEELDSILTRAKYDAIRAEGKNFEDEKDRAPVESDVNHAQYPRYTGYRSNFAELARSVIARVPGAKMAGERLLKGTDDSKDYARDVSNDMGVLSKVVLSKHAAESEERQAAIFQTKSEAEAAVRRSGMRRQAMIVPLTGKISKGGYAVVMSPAEAKGRGIWQPKEDARLQIAPELMEELLDKVAAYNAGKAYPAQITVGYYFDSVRESRKRLHGMGLETAPELRAALREYVGLRAAGRARDRVKELERALAGNTSVGIDFFPTPAPLAQRMADALEMQPGMTVLEPSAGKGNLADAVRAAEPGAQIDAVEMSSTLREILKEKGYPLVGSDFMEFKPDELYDRIIMNPPFSKGMDADHVRHAYDMLKPGGRLVAITGEGIFFREDQKSKDFREWFDKVGGTSENMEGAFLDRREVKTTGVASRLLTIDKPGDGRGDGPAYHRAYHGSPHDFDHFTLQKIGSGEGAQAFGWGLYFAGKKDVAEFYRDSLTARGQRLQITPELRAALNEDGLLGFDSIGEAAQAIYQYDDWKERWDPSPEMARAGDAWRKEQKAPGRGKLYQVQLAPKEDEYLLWDTPLNQQPAVKAALEKGKHRTLAEGIAANWTGKKLYFELAEAFADKSAKDDGWTSFVQTMNDQHVNMEEASKYLLSLGVPGIKYADQRSRFDSGGEKTFNYVIFDDSLVKVEAKYRRGPEAAGGAMRAIDARAFVQKLTKDWKNAPGLEVVGKAADLPFAAPDDALGAFWRGKTYIVAGNHATDAELQFTVFHETLGHAGLRGFFGKDLDPALEQLWVSNANVRRAAADWMAKNAKPADWTARDYRLQAVEEALSNLAGSGREISGLGKLMAAIQAWLRAHGFSAVADFLESLTDAEALHVLSQARQHIVAGDAPQVLTAGMAANFSRPSSVFYSELSRRIAVHSMPTAPAAQWASIIKNMQGVKPDEVEWSGVLDWLGMQEGKVSREALVDYLAANGVKVEETVLGDDEKSAAITDAEREENLGRLQREYMEWGERNGFGRDLSSADEMLGRSDITLTDEQRSYLRNFGRRWDTAQYGTSELEQLRVSLDARGFDIEDDEIAGIFALKRRADGKLFSDSQGAEHEDNFGGQLSDLPDDVTRDAYRYMELREHQEGYKVVPGATQYEKYTLPGGKNYRELLLSWPDQKIQAAADRKEDVTGRYFKNVHFQEVDNYNVLAHVRFNERTDSEGKRVLFVEEVQSDWAQTGRRQGFQTLGGLDDQQQALLKAYHARVKESGMRSLSPREKAQYKQLDETQRAYEKEKVLKVAPGPFVQKTDQWAALVLKRMIAWAVQNGFDRVAWTNGDQQADRYDLSKHISHINWGKLDDGSYNFQAYGKSYDDGANPVLTQSGVKASGLADFIGKDAADKILSSSGTRGSLSNLDLKIGGEGMRDFYDNVLPTIANNVLKKLGGGRVANVMIHRQIQIAQESPANGGGWYVAEAGSGGVVLENDLKTKADAEKWADEHAKVLRQPGFDITAKMKETLRDGVPLFSRAIERAERMEAPAFSRKDDDVVPAPSGAKNFGEITPELAKEIKREPGEIQLTRAGLAHIEERRGDRIRGDWPSIEAFVEYVGRNFNMVLQPKSTAQLVLVRANGKPDFMFVELEPGTGGVRYAVRSAYEAKPSQLQNRQARGEWTLLWDGRGKRATDSGNQPLFAEQRSDATGTEATSARGQGNEDSTGAAGRQDGRPLFITTEGKPVGNGRHGQSRSWTAAWTMTRPSLQRRDGSMSIPAVNVLSS
jgi:phospholipid N-methyltransferase